MGEVSDTSCLESRNWGSTFLEGATKEDTCHFLVENLYPEPCRMQWSWHGAFKSKDIGAQAWFTMVHLGADSVAGKVTLFLCASVSLLVQNKTDEKYTS